MPRRGKAPKARKSRARPRQRKGRSRMSPPANGGWAAPAGYSHGAGGFGRLPAHDMNTLDFCRAVCDPFAACCVGMKWPDGLNARSLTYQLRYDVARVVDSNGWDAIAFTGNLPYNLIDSSTTTAQGRVTWPTAWLSAPMPGVLGTYGLSYRVLSWGLKVNVVSPVPDTGGRLYFNTRQEPEKLTIAGGSPVPSYFQIGNYYGIDVSVYPLSTGRTYYWIAKPQGPRVFRNFDQHTNVDVQVTSDTTNVVVSMAGGVASKTRINIEVFINLEYTLKPEGVDAGISTLASKDPTPNPTAIAVALAASARTPHALEASDGGLRQQMLSEVKQALGTVGKAAIGRAAGAAVRAIGNG